MQRGGTLYTPCSGTVSGVVRRNVCIKKAILSEKGSAYKFLRFASTPCRNPEHPMYIYNYIYKFIYIVIPLVTPY